MAKADNMLAILMLLRARKKMTARQLAEELEIHIRSVYRYIDALCASGVPIVSETGKDGGYYIPENVKLDPLFFDAEEQKALLHAAQFVRQSGYPHEEALNRAIAKIKRYTAAEQHQQLEAAENRLEVVHPPANARLVSKLAEIEQAMTAQTTLELDYYAGYEGTYTKRKVDPYGLVNWKDKWYLVGFCHLRSEIRSFRVDRIGLIRRTAVTFQRPTPFSARQYLLGSLLPKAAEEPEEEQILLHIEGSPHALDDLCAHWLFSHALVERTADSAVFQLDERSLYTHAPYYLLSFGGKIQILQPSELRACLADIAEALVHHYRM